MALPRRADARSWRLTATRVLAALAFATLVWPFVPVTYVSGQPAEARVVRIQTLNVYDTLYMLRGGSQSVAMMREEGVVLVDSQPPGWGKPLLAAIETVTDQPVRTIIHTHAHADHVGGNPELPTATDIVAHANTRTRMAARDAFIGPNARFLPNRIVSETLTLFSGADRIDLHYFGKGHTDGDLVVVFPEKRIAHVGDLIVPRAVPVIDLEQGGSGLALPDTLARVVAQLTNIARVTTGHDGETATRASSTATAMSRSPRTLTWADVQEYADFTRDFVAAVRRAVAEGKTAAQAASGLQLPARYQGYDMQHAAATVGAIYQELGK